MYRSFLKASALRYFALLVLVLSLLILLALSRKSLSVLMPDTPRLPTLTKRESPLVSTQKFWLKPLSESKVTTESLGGIHGNV